MTKRRAEEELEVEAALRRESEGSGRMDTFNYDVDVQEGIRILNKVIDAGELEKDWYNRINLDTLDQWDTTLCVLGQLFGIFHKGLDIIEEVPGLVPDYMNQPNPFDRTEYGLSTEAWRRAIRKLRAEEKPEEKESITTNPPVLTLRHNEEAFLFEYSFDPNTGVESTNFKALQAWWSERYPTDPKIVLDGELVSTPQGYSYKTGTWFVDTHVGIVTINL